MSMSLSSSLWSGVTPSASLHDGLHVDDGQRVQPPPLRGLQPPAPEQGEHAPDVEVPPAPGLVVPVHVPLHAPRVLQRTASRLRGL